MHEQSGLTSLGKQRNDGRQIDCRETTLLQEDVRLVISAANRKCDTAEVLLLP